MKARDLTGLRVGRLVALEDVGQTKQKRRLWRCRCDCGNLHDVQSNYLVNGETQSCGCLAREVRAAGGPVHGGRYTRAYSCWCNMKQRCDNPNSHQFKDWGGRGIKYDPRWARFESFLDDMGDPPEGHSLDRKDNNADYCKENCRWTTADVQRRNSRQIRWMMHEGKQICLRDYCAIHDIKYSLVLCRLSRGWDLEDALMPALTYWARN